MAATTLSPDLQVLDDEREIGCFSRWRTTDSGQRLAESSLRIGGMHCTACATTVERALRAVDGVLDARVSAASACATVQWAFGETRPSVLVEAVARAGYQAVPDTAAGVRSLRQKESRDAAWRLFVAAFCAMQVMMLATPAYLGEAGHLLAEHKRVLDWGSWLLSLPVMVFSAGPFLTGAWRSLRGRRIGMDVPAALGMLVAFVASTGAAFDPGGLFGREVYFDSLTMFVSFLLAGRYLEMCARHQAERSLEASFGRMPEVALKMNADGGTTPISVLRLQAGDVVCVPVGEAFCADGVLTQGATRVDESLLTGESAAVSKASGDAVVAGSLNLSAPVAMRVDRLGADTRYEAIVAMMRGARTQRPASLSQADRWAGPFLWGVLALAVGAAAVWSQIDPARSVWVAVSVLIVTCPCALSLAAPSALLSAATGMARRGLLLRRIEAIEGLASMDVLFIDKTGTLTEGGDGQVRMVRLDAGTRWGDDELRGKAWSLANWSTHPLSRMLAKDSLHGEAEVWVDLKEIRGQGLEGCARDGAVWRLGKAPGAPDAEACGFETETWLSRDGRPVACFYFQDTLRPDALAAVQALARDGVTVAMLSGDHPVRVMRTGRQLGLSACLGGLSPADKLASVKEAQGRGLHVAMLGDGINDAPVLAQADTSIAMGAGARIARAQADGVLVSNSLQDLVQARALARRALGVVRQNLAWAALYNLVCVPLALAGMLPPWAAGLGMACSSLVVVLNAWRLSR
ncbi:heavy metal translocating P-type ATPase [Aquabacterium sp.]|uniref:heavy metal translocating P-type ATPase n=1 Tax=Aquabacterium sp. TaxID=1872578 RepID=UPI003D6CABCD